MKKSLLTLGAFGLALVLAGGARAMTMTDLLNGGSIIANDKLFDQWTLIFQGSSSGGAVDTDDIEITGLADGGMDPGPGLRFDIIENAFSVTGTQSYTYIDFQFGFRVSVLDPNLAVIKDGSMELTGFGLSGSTDAGSYIQEKVGTASGLNDLAINDVTASVLSGVPTTELFDAALFQRGSQIFVTTDILVWADIGDSASLTQFTQRFSQAPEPATLVLFVSGLLGLGSARRRLM